MVHAPPLFGSAVVKNHATDLKKEGKCHGEIKIFLQYIVNYQKIIDAIEVIETCFMFK